MNPDSREPGGEEQRRPGSAAVLGGIVLIVVGGCTELAGAVGALFGFVPLLNGGPLRHYHADPVAFLVLVVSLGVAFIGGFGMQKGLRMLRGKGRGARVRVRGGLN